MKTDRKKKIDETFVKTAAQNSIGLCRISLLERHAARFSPVPNTLTPGEPQTSWPGTLTQLAMHHPVWITALCGQLPPLMSQCL